MTDASQIAVPLWAALVAGGGMLTSIVGIVVWVFANFELKSDARSRYDASEKRHESMESRVKTLEETLFRMAENVAYIRGALEPRKEA